MLKIDLWVTFPDGTSLHAGEMVCGDPAPSGQIPGAFRYSPDFLAHPGAFPVDPVSLPLSGKEFEILRPSGIAAVFEDSLPDDWGRKLLVRKAKLPREKQRVPDLLLALGGHGLGALAYSSTRAPGNTGGFIPECDLEALLDAAEQYEQGTVGDDKMLSLLFQAGSSPGGARPKAIVQSEGALWLAKFPSVTDRLSVVRIEAATLSLARKAGVPVPEFRLISCAGRDVLMVRRFDISDRGGRFHMISMGTLLKAEGWYNLGYRDMFDILRKHSFRPEEDLPAMYRQMVFNALIGNTDDHLKNFSMLHGDSGYFLSPAYDLLPDIGEKREHVLYFEDAHRSPGISGFERIGRRIGIRNPRRVAEEILKTVSGWKAEYEAHHVPEADIRRLEFGINSRLT